MKFYFLIFFLSFTSGVSHAQENITFQQLKYILSEKVTPKDLNNYLLKFGYVYDWTMKQPYGDDLYYKYKDTIGKKKHFSFGVTIKDGKKTSVDYTTQSIEDIKSIIKIVQADHTYKSRNVYLSHFNQKDEFIGNEYENGTLLVGTMSFEKKYGIDYSVYVSFYTQADKFRFEFPPNTNH